MLQKYLKDKYGENYEKQAQADYEESKSRINTGNALSNLAEAFGQAAGRSRVGDSDAYFQGLNKQAKENTIGKIAADRDQFVKNKLDTANMQEAARKGAVIDPNSSESVTFRKIIESKFPDVAKSYGSDWSKVSAADQESIFRPLQLKESIEGRKEQARIAAGQRADNRADRKAADEAKLAEKMQGLKTPYGLANTEDDAKKLKEAHESKSNFDNKINEMIALRQKHHGGTIWNREDVARGKQLSKDLLLEYKNMAKLGVLSQSDENIINAIIPEDPLAYASPMAAMQGQDPILGNLKKFKSDSDKDFSTRVATRTREGIKNYGQPGSTGQPKTVVVSKGGETLEIPIEDLADAKKDGYEQLSNMAGQ